MTSIWVMFIWGLVGVAMVGGAGLGRPRRQAVVQTAQTAAPVETTPRPIFQLFNLQTLQNLPSFQALSSQIAQIPSFSSLTQSIPTFPQLSSQLSSQIPSLSVLSQNLSQISSQLSSQIPSLSSLSQSLPSLPQIPSFAELNIPNPFPAPQLVRATTTQFVEVTRRQTVHPACYINLSAKTPCLPVRSGVRDQELELNSELLLEQGIGSLQAAQSSIQPTRAVRMLNTEDVEEPSRVGKYIEFGKRQEEKTIVEDLSGLVQNIQGSEAAQIIQRPFQRQTTEFVTRTVLVTKLEKFTDHRVTATLIAHNCLPVDPRIPRCHTRNPIVEAPVTPEGLSAIQQQQIMAAVEAVNQANLILQQNLNNEVGTAASSVVEVVAAAANPAVVVTAAPVPAVVVEAAAAPVVVEAAAENPVIVDAAADPVVVEAAADTVVVEAAVDPVVVEAAAADSVVVEAADV